VPTEKPGKVSGKSQDESQDTHVGLKAVDLIMAILPIINVINVISSPRSVIGKVISPSTTNWRSVMKRYVIERELPGVGKMTGEELKGAAAKSNGALAELEGKAQWIQSFVADDKTFCIYLAEDEAAVKEHARISGFPANKITEVRGTIDPLTAHS
jgi:hypothetical protein